MLGDDSDVFKCLKGLCQRGEEFFLELEYFYTSGGHSDGGFAIQVHIFV